MNIPSDQNRVDPDLFEALLTALNSIATVGSFALAWASFRKDKQSSRYQFDKFQFRTQITMIETQFEGAFRAMRELVTLFKSVEVRENQFLHDTKLGFGKAAYKFTASEFNYYSQQMAVLNSSFGATSQYATMMISMLKTSRVGGEDSITENLEDIHDELNDIIFNSSSFDQAIIKLDRAKVRVQSYLKSMENLGNE